MAFVIQYKFDVVGRRHNWRDVSGPDGHRWATRSGAERAMRAMRQIANYREPVMASKWRVVALIVHGRGPEESAFALAAESTCHKQGAIIGNVERGPAGQVNAERASIGVLLEELVHGFARAS